MIEKEAGVNLIEHMDCAVEKLRFMLELYQKYRKNLADNLRLLESGELFRWGEEKTLLLREIDEGEYYYFISPLENLLKKL